MPPSCALLGGFAISGSAYGFRCYDIIAPRVLAVGAHDSIAAKAANAKYQLVHACVCFVPGSFKAKFHYAIWSQTGPKLVADLLARASSLLAS